MFDELKRVSSMVEKDFDKDDVKNDVEEKNIDLVVDFDVVVKGIVVVVDVSCYNKIIKFLKF